MSLYVVLCTFPDREVARRIAQAVVEAGLAACVNVLPGVESIYRWEGKLEQSQEVLGIIKTTEAAYAELQAMVKELHPYDVPEIIAVPAAQVEPAYAKWVSEMTSKTVEG